MSASGAYDDRAAVGRRIGQARRELGLTQGDLATRIGVTLGILDRYETGKADPSEKLAQIAEITGRDVSWFTSTGAVRDRQRGGMQPNFPLNSAGASPSRETCAARRAGVSPTSG